jgi:hypothetical protein
MPEKARIEIDPEVRRRIEMERQSSDDTPNDVLRRLLGLEPVDDRRGMARGRAWAKSGVALPHGTPLRMTYNGRQYRAAIDDGEWLAEGQRYRSPSGAARGVARTMRGARPSLDGWAYWEARLPGTDRWVPIGELRVQAALAEGMDDLKAGRVIGPFDSVEELRSALERA